SGPSYCGGSISSLGGDITLTNSTVRRNATAICGVSNYYGLNGGALMLNNSTLADNTYDGVSGRFSSLTVSDSTISNNGGSGMSLSIGTLSVTNNTITNNAQYGIYVYGGNPIIRN